jgi:hypothetical protein
MQATAATSGASDKGEQKKPEVWMAVLPADTLYATGAQWDFVKKHVDGIKFWTIQTDAEAKDWPFQGGIDAPDALKKLIAVLNENRIPLIIEKSAWPQSVFSAGFERWGGKTGPYDDTFAQRAADNEIERIRRVEKLGGTVRYLDVDGPIRHMLYPDLGGPGFLTIERCAQEFTRYMLDIHRVYPKIEFFALTNFPNWGYKKEVAYTMPGMGWGDYFTALEAIIRNAKLAGAPLRGITVDNPYDYAIGRIKIPNVPQDVTKIDWVARILDMEKYVHAHGLEFNLIINSQTPGDISSQLYNKETLEYLELYRQRGGRPDRYIVESWYTHPKHSEVLPESSPDTFTGLVKEVIKRVKGVKG